MINASVIGYGYWGPNIVRNLIQNPQFQVSIICDTDKKKLDGLKKIHPFIKTTQNPNDIFSDKNISAVCIATPISTHFSLAKKALLSDKHVFIEKPLTNLASSAQELATLAKKNNRVLMVDHTFLYTSAISIIKSLIDKKALGQILYFDSMRTNLGLFQSDANVLWDLAVHDISIVQYLFAKKPISISAFGVSHTQNKIESLGFITLEYPHGAIAHINCSWSSPVKLRRMLIGGTKKMIVYDDVEPTEKVKIYDSSFKVKKNDKNKMMVDYRIGDIHIPKIDLKEALSAAFEDFADAILTNKHTRSDGHFGADIVSLLSYADESLRKKGQTVYVKN